MDHLKHVATATRQLFARSRELNAPDLVTIAQALDELAAECVRLDYVLNALQFTLGGEVKHDASCECRACCLARMVAVSFPSA